MIVSTAVAYGIVGLLVAVNLVWLGVVAQPLFEHGIWRLRRACSLRSRRDASSLSDGRSG